MQLPVLGLFTKFDRAWNDSQQYVKGNIEINLMPGFFKFDYIASESTIAQLYDCSQRLNSAGIACISIPHECKGRMHHWFEFNGNCATVISYRGHCWSLCRMHHFRVWYVQSSPFTVARFVISIAQLKPCISALTEILQLIRERHGKNQY